MLSKYQIQLKINNKDKGTQLIIVISLALSVAILSVLFFIRENNESFFNQQAKALIGCDLRIDIAARQEASVTLSEEQNTLLNGLSAQGCLVVQERDFTAILDLPQGKEQFIIRINAKADLGVDECILSEKAAERLHAIPGSQLSQISQDSKWFVKDVEPLLTTSFRVNAIGIIKLHPDAALDLLIHQGYKSLDQLPLTIRITLKGGDASAQENAIRNAFPERDYSRDDQFKVHVSDADEQIVEHRTILALTETMLIVLSIIAFLLSAAGILALFHLRLLRHRDAYALLRVNGMSALDGYRMALYEAVILLFSANFVGFMIGYVFFRRVAERITGIAPTLSLSDAVLWVVALKCLVLSGTLLIICLFKTYQNLFTGEIIDMRRQRQSNRRRKWLSVLELIGYMLLFTLLLRLALNVGVQLTELSASYGMIALLLFGFVLVLLLLYGCIRLCVVLLRAIHLPLRSIFSLVYCLVFGRKTYTCLIGTSLVTGLFVLLMLYNVSSGVHTYFERVWESELGYTASVEEVSGTDVKSVLTTNGFTYTTIYRKLFFASNMPEGSNAQPYYTVGIVKNADDSGLPFDIQPGTFIADLHFLHCNQLQVGDGYAFFDDMRLTCVQEISNLNTTGVFTSVTFSALLSYDDAKDYIDRTYTIAYLLSLSLKETNRLIELGRQYGFMVTTASLYAGSILDSYSNYLSMIYMVCILLGLTVMVFAFSLIYVVVWHRHREFTIYKAFGASQRDIKSIIVMESVFIAIVAALFTVALVMWLFKLVLEKLAFGGIAYSMPFWVVVGIVLFAALLMTAMSLIVIKTFDFGNATDVLRAQE